MSNTVVESPNARFRREAGLGAVSNSRVRVGDWMKLNCGDRVRERDGRHVGRVQAIYWSRTVVVLWDGSGWTSELLLEEVERVRD
jgi:hypothetical protein